MRLCEFKKRGVDLGRRQLGLLEGDMVYYVQNHSTMAELISGGRSLGPLRSTGDGMPLKEVSLLAPFPTPGKIVAAIVNTEAMLGGADVRLDRPRLDMKAPSAVIGPLEAIHAPESGIRPEVELAAVIGSRISHASPAEARSGIMGYTILNDVTAPKDSKDDAYEAYRRDRSTGEIKKSVMRGPLFRSKNHDTFCPLGPWIVTSDELGEVSSLNMTTRFDGMLVQAGSTSEYLFAPEDIASYVSSFLSLEPGDILSCGSVGWAPEALGRLDPTEYVLPRRPGMLKLEIEKIGILQNPVAYGAGVAGSE